MKAPPLLGMQVRDALRPAPLPRPRKAARSPSGRSAAEHSTVCGVDRTSCAPWGICFALLTPGDMWSRPIRIEPLSLLIPLFAFRVSACQKPPSIMLEITPDDIANLNDEDVGAVNFGARRASAYSGTADDICSL
jgi:hypothetical protein